MLETRGRLIITVAHFFQIRYHGGNIQEFMHSKNLIWGDMNKYGETHPFAGRIQKNDKKSQCHYNGVTMSAVSSQITGLTIVYSTVYSGADQRKHQSSASLAFVWGMHQWPVNKGPVTRKIFPFDDVIMVCSSTNARECGHVLHFILLFIEVMFTVA